MRRFIEKKNVFFLLVLIGIFGISFSVFALELDWPESPGGIDLNTKSTQTLTYLIAYIYEWAMAIGGIAAFIALVSAGFQYLTSAGDIAKMSDAKKQITSTITGLVLLLSTFLILNTINPELTTLDIPEITLSSNDDFIASEEEDVSFGDPCTKVIVCPESGSPDGCIDIKKGSKGKITIDKGEGSVSYENKDDEGSGCVVNLYNSYTENDQGELEDCEDKVMTISYTQEDLDVLNITEKVKCVSVD